jgi:hypothetical protein
MRVTFLDGITCQCLEKVRIFGVASDKTELLYFIYVSSPTLILQNLKLICTLIPFFNYEVLVLRHSLLQLRTFHRNYVTLKVK